MAAINTVKHSDRHTLTLVNTWHNACALIARMFEYVANNKFREKMTLL